MASVTNAAQTTNSSSGALQNTISVSRDASTRQTNKSAVGANAKVTDRGRKESPVDQGRRAPPQKAWTSGTNPLTQRGSTPTQANGSIPPIKNTGNTRVAGSKENGMSDKHSHDRLRFILGAAIGLSVVLSTKSGEKFEGIFAGSSLIPHNSKITLKMTKRILSNASLQANGITPQEAALTGTSPEHIMTFDLKDMSDFSIPQLSLPEAAKQTNGTTSSFQTDTDISASSARTSERVLQKWVPDGPDTTDFSLESGNIGQWDQFEAHKSRFGDNSTYDETIYTTVIDRNAPGYKQRAAEANKKAQEILSQTATSSHVREERGLAQENDYEDEEDKYSGVRRDERSFPQTSSNTSNKYIPPAQRAPTAQPTITGAPVDSAIISAQLSKPGLTKPTIPKIVTPPNSTTQNSVIEQPASSSATNLSDDTATKDKQDKPEVLAPTPSIESEKKPRSINTSLSPQRNINVDNPTEDVENQVLGEFRHFAKTERDRISTERERLAESRRAQARQDRAAKLNDLLRFSKTFVLKTPIPTDLVGILAKDPAKQEAIIEKAQKQHDGAKSGTTSTNLPSTSSPLVSSSTKTPPTSKFDASQVPPPIPDRPTFKSSRGGYQQHGTRNDRAALQQGTFAGRGAANLSQRGGGQQQDRRNQAPAPLFPADGRTPPTGPMAESQSPQRSSLHTPTSAALKFNVNAPSFNPSAVAATKPPSSPTSVQRAGSLSRTASPSSFFGARKPRLAAERTSLALQFNPIKRMRKELADKKNASEKPDEPINEFPQNGGIPNAFRTGPVWQVKQENQERSYATLFGRSSAAVSPAQSRSASTQQIPYHGQLPSAAVGPVGMSQILGPQHGSHAAPHAYSHHFDEPRMHMHNTSPQVYPSPGMSSRQMSSLSSPMAHQAQLAYGHPQYFNGPGQIPMQGRPFPGTPGMMHAQPGQMAAPMMVQQQSSGPYMTVPPHYNQMQMYSPNATHAYPQQNGYPSPGRMAPMMMHQGSQQSHHSGQQMMYAVPGQTAPMMYQQPSQMGMMRGGYGAHQAQYGSNSHQAHHMQQRAMSNGYGRGPQPTSQNSGPPANAPQQPAAFGQLEIAAEDAK